MYFFGTTVIIIVNITTVIKIKNLKMDFLIRILPYNYNRKHFSFSVSFQLYLTSFQFTQQDFFLVQLYI